MISSALLALEAAWLNLVSAAMSATPTAAVTTTAATTMSTAATAATMESAAGPTMEPTATTEGRVRPTKSAVGAEGSVLSKGSVTHSANCVSAKTARARHIE